jgi:hypothetical protein
MQIVWKSVMAAKPCECSKKYIGAYLNGEFYGM